MEMFYVFLGLLFLNNLILGYLYGRQKKRGDEWREAWLRAKVSPTRIMAAMEVRHECGHTDAEHQDMMKDALNEKRGDWPIIMDQKQIANLMAALHKEETDRNNDPLT